MARKKKHPEHVNHERWLISYADFITLLFAFFVVMFAVSQVDSKKVGRFTESFSKAVGIEMFPESGAGLMPGGEITAATEAPQAVSAGLPEELAALKARLTSVSKAEDVPTGIQVLERRNELVIRLSENLIFEPGDDTLKAPATTALHAVAHELASSKVNIRIEGHTDNHPIKTARFRSNWDLSTSRATAVVSLLAESKIAPERLSAAGYGEFHPVAPNATADGRRQNRRVDIVVSVMVPDTAPAGAQ
jgi:chemotaxis protein MotB